MVAGTRPGAVLRVALAGSLVVATVAASGLGRPITAPAPGPTYDVYAIRYATSPGFAVSSLVAGADPARTLDIPFMDPAGGVHAPRR